jgi:Mg2+ and Co2+ transporter CorA
MSLTKDDLRQLEIMMEQVSERVSERVSRRVATEVFMAGFEKLVAPQFADIRREIADLRQDINSIKNVFDGLAADYTSLRQEESVGARIQSKHTDQLNNHQKRIARLERARA